MIGLGSFRRSGFRGRKKLSGVLHALPSTLVGGEIYFESWGFLLSMRIREQLVGGLGPYFSVLERYKLLEMVLLLIQGGPQAFSRSPRLESAVRADYLSDELLSFRVSRFFLLRRTLHQLSLLLFNYPIYVLPELLSEAADNQTTTLVEMSDLAVFEDLVFAELLLEERLPRSRSRERSLDGSAEA